MNEILDARESKLVELSKSNLELQETKEVQIPRAQGFPALFGYQACGLRPEENFDLRPAYPTQLVLASYFIKKNHQFVNM